MRTTLNIDNEILEDDVDCVTVASSTGMRMTVHRQVTDAYPFSLARARSGCPATQDRRIHRLLPRGEQSSPHLRIVMTGQGLSTLAQRAG